MYFEYQPHIKLSLQNLPFCKLSLPYFIGSEEAVVQYNPLCLVLLLLTVFLGSYLKKKKSYSNSKKYFLNIFF